MTRTECLALFMYGMAWGILFCDLTAVLRVKLAKGEKK